MSWDQYDGSFALQLLDFVDLFLIDRDLSASNNYIYKYSSRFGYFFVDQFEDFM